MKFFFVIEAFYNECLFYNDNLPAYDGTHYSTLVKLAVCIAENIREADTQNRLEHNSINVYLVHNQLVITLSFLKVQLVNYLTEQFLLY
jgi:hypothetical protein